LSRQRGFLPTARKGVKGHGESIVTDQTNNFGAKFAQSPLGKFAIRDFRRTAKLIASALEVRIIDAG
jgi:hypothetical protein